MDGACRHKRGLRNAYSILVGNVKGEDQWEDQGRDRMIILK
jgi:hypothetical protein